MSSVITNYAGNAFLTEYVKNGGGDGKGAWVGLFTGDLTTAGIQASEVSGGDYARERPLDTAGAGAWSNPASKTIGNTVAFHFTNLPDCVVTHFALLTLAAGGDMIMTMLLATPLTFTIGDDLKIDANDLAWTL
jgi:hypothetical protein